MPAWLVEGSPTLYFLFACAGVVCAASWWRTRKRKYAVGVGVAGLLILGVWLLDRAIESEREQIVRKVYEVADAITAGDIDGAFRHVSEHFERSGWDRARFHEFARNTRQNGNVTAVRVWDVMATESSRENRRGVVEFPFKVRGRWGETPPSYFARVVFMLDNDGEWRVQTFDVYNTLTESATPVSIPGWGR
jgi:hypothetical protein